MATIRASYEIDNGSCKSATMDHIAKGDTVAARSLSSSIGLLFLIVVFPVIYGFKPLYYSDQNDKFLHGLAKSGFGFLRDDWVARTPDPFVAFSALVALTSDIHAGLFYVYFAVLIGIYAWSLMSIVSSTVDFASNHYSLIIFLVGMLTVHSAVFAGYKLGPEDLRYLFTGGMAHKSMFHPYLAPDTFSVFILCSIALYLRGHVYAAVAANAVACTFHAHYFLPAALITVSFLLLHWRDKKSVFSVFALGGVALVLVLPILLYNLLHFAPTTPALHERALFIFNHLRIAHHVEPQRWMDTFVAVKALFVVVALVLLRNSTLSFILMPLFLATVILTTLQLVTGNEDLAYLLPWRHVAFLVPVATTLLLALGARTTAAILSYRNHRTLAVAAIVWFGFLSFTGARQVYAIANTSIPYVDGNLRPLVEHVRRQLKSGQLYLIPLRMETFRLATGAPIFVDWKAVPFGDLAVLEWYRRFQLTDLFYKSQSKQKWAMLVKLAKEEGITHVILPTDTLRDLPISSDFTQTFQSQNYTIYEIPS